MLRQAQNKKAILETRMFLAPTSVSMSDVNIIQNIPPQKLFHIHIIHISHNPLGKSVKLCGHRRMHIMDKDMVGPSYALCTCH